jgi:hypothetical protein
VKVESVQEAEKEKATKNLDSEEEVLIEFEDEEDSDNISQST